MSVLFTKLSPGMNQAQACAPPPCSEESAPEDAAQLSILEIQNLLADSDLEPLPRQAFEELDELAIEALLDASLLGEAPPLPPEPKTRLDLTIRDWKPLFPETGTFQEDIRPSREIQTSNLPDPHKKPSLSSIGERGGKFSVRNFFRLFRNHR